MNDPGFRNVTFDELVAAYTEAANGLLDGGADILLVETIFDTLNAKAALFAIEEVFDARGERVPVMISGTITDQSGRTLTGQTAEAFWYSMMHARPLSASGSTARSGAKDLRRHVQELSRVSRRATSPRTRTPACPTSSAATTRRPEAMADVLREFAESGLVNIVGGCCGTTPDAHPRASPRRCATSRRARGRPIEPRLRLSGLEPVVVGPDTNFVNIGERTNVTGSRQFAKLILAGDYDQGARRRAPAGRERRAAPRRQHGRGDARRGGGDDDVPAASSRGAGHRARAGHRRLVEVVA